MFVFIPGITTVSLYFHHQTEGFDVKIDNIITYDPLAVKIYTVKKSVREPDSKKAPHLICLPHVFLSKGFQMGIIREILHEVSVNCDAIDIYEDRFHLIRTTLPICQRQIDTPPKKGNSIFTPFLSPRRD